MDDELDKDLPEENKVNETKMTDRYRRGIIIGFEDLQSLEPENEVKIEVKEEIKMETQDSRSVL